MLYCSLALLSLSLIIQLAARTSPGRIIIIVIIITTIAIIAASISHLGQIVASKGLSCHQDKIIGTKSDPPLTRPTRSSHQSGENHLLLPLSRVVSLARQTTALFWGESEAVRPFQ